MAYSSPKPGTNFVFKIVRNPDSKKPKVSHQRYRVKTIKGDTVRWYREPMKGKGPVEDVILYRAFARTYGNGLEYKFELGAYDQLWPLKQGNEASYNLTVLKGAKETMRLKANFCVRGSKKLKVGAGEYKAHLIDISQTVVKGPKKMAWDTIEVQAWYVPQFGTALLMEDRILKKGKVIMIRRREAIKISN